MTTEQLIPAKLNKIEKAKAEKPGLAVKAELAHFAEIGWEAVDKTDLEMRLKWLGIFFRPVTPGKFMLRLRIPNGCLNSQQLRVLAEIIQRYDEDGSADITTRQNLQLRGIRVEDTPTILQTLEQVGLTSLQSGMDNVRNLTGSPVAGIDPDELIDTRELLQKIQDMITAHNQGNEELSNLPRKFNIAIEGARDNSIHAEINDLAFIPAFKNDILGFNVLIGGYLSAQRCAESVAMDVWVPADDTVVALSHAILKVYSDNGLAAGLRESRAKARLMWLVDTWGMEKFRAAVETCLGQSLERAAPTDEITEDKKDHLGVHAQKQAGLNYVGLHVPMGRFDAEQMFELARLAAVYGNGELRLTVEQNVILTHIPTENLEPLLAEPLLQTFQIAPSPLSRSVISCTGARYCNFALIETKQRAWQLAQELDAELALSQRVRIHWTGCPNSCGQPQAGDIGLIGSKTRQDGQTVEAANIYTGGKVGKGACLGSLQEKNVPMTDLKDHLRQILIDQFGAVPK